jgi:beta-phosphoglucomutase-like phosphatase (HAD superfamily)
MYDLKTRYFHERPEPPVMPGVRRLMSQAAADGLTICVVTGSGQRPLINRLMRDFGDYLTDDCIVTAYDVTRGKPAPDPYLMGLQKAGRAVRLHATPDNNPTAQASKPEDCALKPWEAVVVENAPLGVRAGVAANIFTVAVNTGPLPDSILLDAGADLLFSSMTDFADAWKDLKTFVTD